MFLRHRTKAFLKRARTIAIPLSFDPPEESIEMLSILDDALEGKRIVYLGEEDHWVHEKTDYRLLLLRYLLSRGFNTIGEELGWSDGMRTDEFLQNGDASLLGRIATYGYRGDLRQDREELPHGILKASTDHYPTEAFKAEQLRLLSMLRNVNESRIPAERIRFFGFDINAVVGGGYADIKAMLKPQSQEVMVARLLSTLEIVPNESYEPEILRLQDAIDMITSDKDTFTELLGEHSVRALERNIQSIQKSLEYYRLVNTAASYEELNPAMALREMLMADHVQYMLDSMGPNGKLVLMGHNRHLCKDIFSIRNAGASPPGGGLVPSLGTSLFRRYPSEIFSIWMLFETGQNSLPSTALMSTYTSHPKRLNAVLSQVGDTFLLPLYADDSCLLRKPMDITGIYNLPFRTAIADQTDAIFFTRTVSKLRP